MKLCFGTFAAVLVKCKTPVATQKQLVGTMLLSVNETYDIRTDDEATSALALGKKNLSDYIRLYIDDVAPADIRAYFSENVIPLLDLNKKGNIVLALRSIIAEDTDITDDREVEVINGLTKADILAKNSIVFEDLLAGLFIYIVKNTVNNKQEKNVRGITDAFIRYFDRRRNEVSFISSYSLKNNDVIDTLATDTSIISLLAECGGTCPRCGKVLTSDGSTVFHLDNTNDVILCLECAGKVQGSEDERSEMKARKIRMQEHFEIRDAIAANRLSEEITELLRIISSGEPLAESTLSMTPLKVEQKVTDKQLLRKIVNNVIDGMYEMVNDAIERLSAENKLNVKEFRRSIKRMYEDAEDASASQSDIFNGLVTYLYAKSGQKYYEACEIVISYFVQSCEVFHEIAG